METKYTCMWQYLIKNVPLNESSNIIILKQQSYKCAGM